MKYLAVCFFCCLSQISTAQTKPPKLPKDSVIYYRKELNKLWRNTYDSLRNSDRYKEMTAKLRTKPEKVVTVELLANIGLYFTDFRNLNNRLKSIGEEEIKSMVPSLGASVCVSLPIMAYGLELDAYAFDNKNASFKGVHGRFYLATTLFRKSPIALHPQVGIVGSTLNMFIHRPPNQVNFDDLFLTDANTIQLNHDQTYLDLGLGIKLKSPKVENLYWQFFRIGYRYGFKEVTWGMRGGTINNPPADRNNQFYVQFCLGLDRD